MDKKTPFLLSIGPILLLAAFVVPVHGELLWKAGLGTSVVISSALIAIALQELKPREVKEDLSPKLKILEQEVCNLQSALIEAKQIDALNEVRTEKFQLETLKEFHEKEIRRLTELLHLREAELAEQGPIAAQYRELRKQFDEKAEVLSKTRLDLFRLENELLATKKEQEQIKIEPTVQEEILSRDLENVEASVKA